MPGTNMAKGYIVSDISLFCIFWTKDKQDIDVEGPKITGN